MIQIKVNGVQQTFHGDPEMPLLWYLRDELETHGNQVRLRHGALRRLHGAQERRGDSVLR